MMKLHDSPFSRALYVRWLLEALELPYELATLDIFKGEQKSPSTPRSRPVTRA
jgi:glutathione S-transferase